MVTLANQARRYAKERAASLRAEEHVDLREAAYIAACEIDVLHFDALHLIKEAIAKRELLAKVVRETHVGPEQVREYVDLTQSEVAVTDLMQWLQRQSNKRTAA